METIARLQYFSHILPNGLKVIVHPDTASPKAVFNLLYRVGSRDEDPERTGFAHLFEHLMFRGSKNVPAYDTPLQRVGGQNNAFTSSDVTNYHISLPANQLETAFWLESDRMLELSFSEESLEKEKGVVIEEFKQRYLNQPYGDAHLKLRELHFQVHPYRWSTIGKDMDHIAGATLDEVRAFFYGFYAPNNATLVVAGDVDPDEVFRLAEKWFGEIPARPLRKHPLPAEPPQSGARNMTLRGEVPSSMVYKMYHVPAAGTRAHFVVDMLAELLSGGRNSLLFRQLVKEQALAASVGAFSWELHDPGILSIDAQLHEGISPAQYENALQATLDSIRELNAEGRARLLARIESGTVMGQTTLLNKAIALAFADTLGDTELVNTALDTFRSISLTELKAGAEEIFRPENCSTLYYLPQTN